MRFIIYLAAVYSVFSLFSCKEVLPARKSVNSIDSTYVQSVLPAAQPKVVLLEEFTGASCPNCPDGHKIAKEIKALYSTQFMSIALHPKDNSLSKPAKEGAEDISIEEAKTLSNRFGISSLPSGLIDRRSFDGTQVIGRFLWKEKVQSLINEKVKVNVSSKVTYESQFNENVLELNYTVLDNYSDDLMFTLLLIEDKLQIPQKEGLSVIDDYVQDHVVRKFYTSATGNALSKIEADGGIYKKGRSFLKKLVLEDFSKTKYKWENLYFVTFVTNANTGEVLQTSYCKAKP